jgi:hypothetical protein
VPARRSSGNGWKVCGMSCPATCHPSTSSVRSRDWGWFFWLRAERGFFTWAQLWNHKALCAFHGLPPAKEKYRPCTLLPESPLGTQVPLTGPFSMYFRQSWASAEP